MAHVTVCFFAVSLCLQESAGYSHETMRLRPSPEWEPVFASLQTFKSRWPARGWSWDNRLFCITSSLVGELLPRAEETTSVLFPERYTVKNLSEASPEMRELVERSGGLRPNQIAFCSGPPKGGLVVYGLWWPWNDQETVSVRVGLLNIEPPEEPSLRFLDVFGVSIYS